MTDELKNCPFCGGEAELITWHEHTEARHVQCKTCKCMTGSPHFMREFAFKDWNTRTPSDVTDKTKLPNTFYLHDNYVHGSQTGVCLNSFLVTLEQAYQLRSWVDQIIAHKSSDVTDKADGGEKSAALDFELFDHLINLVENYLPDAEKCRTTGVQILAGNINDLLEYIKPRRAALRQGNSDLLEALEKIKGGYIDSGTKSLSEGYWTQFIADLQQIAKDALLKHKAKG